jgi:outer membrane immunogenic protein
MKKLLLGSVALFALSVGGPALAADYAAPAYKAPPPAPYYNWSGYYVGFNIGGQWDTVNRTFPNPTGGTPVFITGLPFSTDSNDGIFGTHLGLQYQFGYWVLGIEAALSAGFHEMRGVSGVLPVGNPGFGPGLTGEHKITNIFTVGPKLGYAFDRWMIYGTGGYAQADLKGTFCLAATGQCGAPFFVNTGNGESRNKGWYAGAGIDYMIHKGTLVDVILGAEYQHWDVKSERAFCFNLACTGGGVYNLDAHGDIFRAKLTIKYNPWYSAPVYAKY